MILWNAKKKRTQNAVPALTIAIRRAFVASASHTTAIAENCQGVTSLKKARQPMTEA